MLILIIPFGIIHELGHGIICASEGIEFTTHISPFGSSIICHGDVANKDLFHVMGGLLASVVAITPYLFAKKHLEKLPYLSIVLLSLAVGHAVNAVIETAFFDSYIDNNIVTVFSINMVSMIAFIYFAYYYSKTTLKQKQDNLINDIKEKLDDTPIDQQEEKTKEVLAEIESDRPKETVTEKILKQIESINTARKLLSNEPIYNNTPTSQTKKASRKVKSTSKRHATEPESYGFSMDEVFDISPNNSAKPKKYSFFGEPEWSA